MNSSEQEFKQRLIQALLHFKAYELKSNQEAALKLIPVELLQTRAKAKFQKYTNNMANEQILLQDFLLAELTAWFKEDFFQWMDSPKCPFCAGTTKLISHGTPTPMELLFSAGRVEVYTCSKCFPFDENHEVARFPRYNDPAKLLTTRTGRCGEWANCFALICRSMSFEVRHIIDWTDHVWVEIFSQGKNRWIHCDPCENKIDSPLLYEVGWGKKLSYVIGVSQDDIQDVTWRYSTVKNFKNVLARRTLVREKWLVSTILELRKQYQVALPNERKQILQDRLVKELIEFINPDKDTVQDSEKEGRLTGSLEWRMGRQELGNSFPKTGHIWMLSEDMISSNNSEIRIYYNSATDSYSINDRKHIVKTDWSSGAFCVENIYRKREMDWKKVYLAREEKHGEVLNGKLSWKLEVSHDSKYLIQSVHIAIPTSAFHSSVKTYVEIVTDNGNKIQVPESGLQNDMWRWSGAVSNARSIILTCRLCGGNGDNAWQQGQLFRMSTENHESQELLPFLAIKLKQID